MSLVQLDESHKHEWLRIGYACGWCLLGCQSGGWSLPRTRTIDSGCALENWVAGWLIISMNFPPNWWKHKQSKPRLMHYLLFPHKTLRWIQNKSFTTLNKKLGGGFTYAFIFTPKIGGKWSNLTVAYFFSRWVGWNHQPVERARKGEVFGHNKTHPPMTRHPITDERYHLSLVIYHEKLQPLFNLPGPSNLGAKWFRYRVSNHHPLGFHWHPDWKVLVGKYILHPMDVSWGSMLEFTLLLRFGPPKKFQGCYWWRNVDVNSWVFLRRRFRATILMKNGPGMSRCNFLLILGIYQPC